MTISAELTSGQRFVAVLALCGMVLAMLPWLFRYLLGHRHPRSIHQRQSDARLKRELRDK
jgi:hypothetical protein